MSNVAFAALGGLVVGALAVAYLTMAGPVASAASGIPGPELTRSWSPAGRDCYQQCIRQIAGTDRYFVLQSTPESMKHLGGTVMPEEYK